MKWTKIDGVSASPSPHIGVHTLMLALPVKIEKMDEVKSLFAKPFELVLQKRTKKRSLNANSLCWKLCDELGKALNLSKEEIYRRAIKQVGVYEPLTMQKAAYERFKQAWEGHGIGWVVDKLLDDGILIQCNAYYGSSTYNSAEMARLIDWIVEEANAQGIDTMTPQERGLLIDEWKSGEKEKSD